MRSCEARARAIFNRAMLYDDKAQRNRFVDEACGNDHELRELVEWMIISERNSAQDSTCAPTADTESSFETESVVGPYKLLTEIGHGGMGIVYFAEQVEPVARRVAVKVVKPGMDSQQVIARFEAERQALAMMDHPNIATVLDAGTTRLGRPFFVMELVKGIPITQYCDEHNLSMQERLRLFVPICEAVQHAHQKGIIHRDLKPSNVLVAIYDGQATPKIIDFGVAKAISHRLTEKTVFTQLGQIVGTVEYMSPEQADASQLDIDTRTDIYSLGVLLYELLTGETPFDSNRLRSAGYDELRRIIRDEEPPKPSTKLSSTGDLPAVAAHRRADPQRLQGMVKGDLDWIVMKAIDKDRSRRYETANGLALEVLRFLHDEPVLACPPSSAYKLKKLIRRNRAQFLGASIVAMVLLLGIFGTIWGMVWALRERARVTAQSETAADAIREANRIVLETVEDLNGEFGSGTADDLPTRDLSESQGLEVDALGESSIELARYLSRSLREEAQSRMHAEQTAEELALVVNFQAAQLRELDVHLMGAQMKQNLLESMSELKRHEDANLEQSSYQNEDFEEAINNVDFTGLALEALERHMLSSALSTINDQFADQPLVRAHLLQSVAETMREFGLLDLAADPQFEALRIRRLELGNDDPATLSSTFQTGRLHYEKGRLEEAEELFEEALAGRRISLGDLHPDTLRSINWMGNLRNLQHRPVEAEKFLRESLEGRRQTLGEMHRDTLESHNDLGISLKLQDRFDEALTHYMNAYEGFRRVLGDDHPWTLVSMYNLGRAYRDEGRLADAEYYYSESLKRRREVLGNEHPDTLNSIRAMATLLVDQGKYEEAEPMFKDVLAQRRRVLGNDHSDTLNTIRWLAHIYFEQGRLEESEPYYRETYEIIRRVNGENAEETLAALRSLARLYESQDKFADAEPLYRELVKQRVVVLGEQAPDTLVAKVWVAHVCERQDKFEDAEQMFKEALESQRSVLGDLHKHTLTTMWGLGRTLVRAGKLSDAEPLIRECYLGRKEVFDESDWHVFHTLSLLGECLAKQDRFDEAEAMLLESVTKMDVPASAKDKKVDAMQRIVDLYQSWHEHDPSLGHFDRANEWIEKRVAYETEVLPDESGD